MVRDSARSRSARWVQLDPGMDPRTEDPRTELAEARAADFRDEGHGYDVFGLHLPALERWIALSRPIYDRWFRVTSQGASNVPRAGAAILVANHSGALPVDALMLSLDVLRHTPRIPRVVADRFVPKLPFVGEVFARGGAVSGTRANVRRLLEAGALVVIFPEGTTGVGKRFRDRYHLQDWRVGHVELAIRHRAPVVPAAIIGAEESWPVAVKIRGVHAFGAPYLPIPASPVPLPVHYRIHYGPPVVVHEDLPPEAADDPDVLARAADRTRAAVEAVIAEGLAARRGS